MLDAWENTQANERTDRDAVTYVPQWVLDCVSAENGSLSEAQFSEVRGMVMLVDIVGFTSLTEILSADDPSQGAEDISIILNVFFDKVLQAILSFGGDVIQFSGDGILSVFPEDTQQAGVVRCFQCAVAVSQLNGTTVNLRSCAASVSLRIGVGRGEIRRLLFPYSPSGPWTSLVCGDACCQAFAACEGLLSGELRLPQSVAEAVQQKSATSAPLYCCDNIDDEDVPDLSVASPWYAARGDALPPPQRAADAADPPLPSFAVNPLVPSALSRFLCHGASRGTTNELRSVVVLFVRLAASVDPPQDVPPLGEKLFKTVLQYGGACNKLVCDDKGLVAVVCFGLPLHTYADNAERACFCAAAVTEAISTPVAVGVAKGRVFCGEVGNARRKEYTVLGDAVNVSSRLMMLGSTEPGSSVVVEESVLKESTRVPLARTESVTVKGKAHEVNVSYIDLPSIAGRSRSSIASRAGSGLSTRASSSQNIPCVLTRTAAGLSSSVVGRDAVRRELNAFVRAAGAGDAASQGFLMIHGTPGMGKTTMLSLCAETAARADLPCVLLRPEVGPRGDVNGDLRRFVSALVEGEGESHWVIDALCARGGLAREDAELLMCCPVEGDQWTPRSPTQPLPALRPEAAKAAYLSLLSALARRSGNGRAPAALVLLDDAHAFDRRTLAALVDAASSASRIALIAAVGVFGSGKTGNADLTPLYAAQHQEVLLGPMDANECDELCRHTLRVSSVDKVLLTQLKKCDGCPLLICQVLERLQQSSALEVHAGHVELRAPDSIDVDALLARCSAVDGEAHTIDRAGEELSPVGSEILKVVCTVGSPVEERLLCAVLRASTPADQAAVAAQLDLLVRLNVLHEAPPQAYFFRTHAMSVVQYSGLLSRERTELHLRVAEATESLCPELQGLSSAEEVARHFEQGGFPALASEYRVIAAEQAVREGAYGDATRHILRCFDYMGLEHSPSRSDSSHGNGRGRRSRRGSHALLSCHELHWKVLHIKVLVGEYVTAHQDFLHLAQVLPANVEERGSDEYAAFTAPRPWFPCLCVGQGQRRNSTAERTATLPLDVADAYAAVFAMAILCCQLGLATLCGIRLLLSAKHTSPSDVAMERLLAVLRNAKAGRPASLPRRSTAAPSGVADVVLACFLEPAGPWELGDCVAADRFRSMAGSVAPLCQAARLLLLGRTGDVRLILADIALAARRCGQEHAFLSASALHALCRCLPNSCREGSSSPVGAADDGNDMFFSPQYILRESWGATQDPTIVLACTVALFASQTTLLEAEQTLESLRQLAHKQWTNPIAMPSLVLLPYVILQKRNDKVIGGTAAEEGLRWASQVVDTLSFSKEMCLLGKWVHLLLASAPVDRKRAVAVANKTKLSLICHTINESLHTILPV